MAIKKAIVGMFLLKKFFLVDIYFCVKLGGGGPFIFVKSLILTKRNMPDEGNERNAFIKFSLFEDCYMLKSFPSLYLSLNLNMSYFRLTKIKIKINRT